MRKVIVIYDDTRKPDAAIRSITGEKSFGNTIFKRISLCEHIRRNVMTVPSVETFLPATDVDGIGAPENKGLGAVLMYSSFIISDLAAFSILIEKAVYAHENYKILCNGKIACIIFYDVAAFLAWDGIHGESYAEIECTAFTDISEVSNFRQFITSGFEARFFNSVLGDEYTVVKRSANADKIKAEHDFYYFLPDSMKQWFVHPFDLQITAEGASYKMERFHMADLAIRYVHGAIGTEEFANILEKLFYFVGSRSAKNVSKEEYDSTADSLYVKKVRERIELLKTLKEFDRLEVLIKNLTAYEGIDALIDDYIMVYNKVRGGRNFRNIAVAGHGDMCFSNILYSDEASMLKLIDPKGAVSAEDIYTDPYYDLAKLSHSVCGRYDFINSDLYEINMDANLNAHLVIDYDNSKYVEMFSRKLSENGIDFRLLRLYECSLFLSMLPLHIDRPRKVFAFVLNAIEILDEIKKM